MSTAIRTELRQRADYTHKHNLKTGRHGWLRLTPAYSVKIVEELIAACDRPMHVLDPFCGTATTALSAAYHGHHGTTTDINPFLVWLGNAKTADYDGRAIAAAAHACTRACGLVEKGRVVARPAPPIHNIERWWSAPALSFLRSLRTAIDETTDQESQERTLLLIAFCRTLIGLSNAAFNHQSMSFKDEGQQIFALDHDFSSIFAQDVRFILNGAADNPCGTSDVILADARLLDDHFKARSIDRVITSPPYANRMSYIRELRPYMYWLDFLTNARDAGELDWTAIGGTWGIATSRLMEWERPSNQRRCAILEAALPKIAAQDNKSSEVLSRYVAKYFDDMWQHFQSLTKILEDQAELHYIVGNSTFYGVLLHVEQIYARMLSELGFTHIECRPIRKRNSKKELIEFDVTARWRP